MTTEDDVEQDSFYFEVGWERQVGSWRFLSNLPFSLQPALRAFALGIGSGVLLELAHVFATVSAVRMQSVAVRVAVSCDAFLVRSTCEVVDGPPGLLRRCSCHWLSTCPALGSLIA